MYREQNKFYAYCEKSFYDPFFTVDLTDFKREKPSLMNMLQNETLLKENILSEDEVKFINDNKESDSEDMELGM